MTNESFDVLLKSDPSMYKVADISSVSPFFDTISPGLVNDFLSAQLPFSCVIIGDIFWPTGQNICAFCEKHEIVCCFLQHGQWIYDLNKRNPKHVPAYTFLLGQDVMDRVSRWPYATCSKLVLTGSPRYQFEHQPTIEGQVYCAPPVVHEQFPSAPMKIHRLALRQIQRLRGLDKYCRLMIHPHYREAKPDFLSDLFPNALILDRDKPVLPTMSSCVAVITHRNSTSVLDSIACDKSCVLLDFDDPAFFPRDYFYPFAIESDSPKGLFDAVENINQPVSDGFNSMGDFFHEAKKFIYLGNSSARIEVSIFRQTTERYLN